MLLIADIGNTSITLGIYEGETLIETLRLASDKEMPQIEYEMLLQNLLKDFAISACVIASVVDELTERVKSALDKTLKINSIVFNSSSATPVKLPFSAEQLGADRLANALGAVGKYDLPVIVIDFGTATTFDIINEKMEFIGGVIAPGLNLQLKSLNKFTSKLPRIEVAISPTALGKNTTEAILSGVIRGSAAMIDGLVEQCEKELGAQATIVATGGYSTLIANYLKRPFDFINPTLTLDGLREFYLTHQNPCDTSGHEASECSTN